MQIIGLTGGIGSGKSTVANLFRDLGVPLVDTDLIAHQLGQAGADGAAAVLRLFGPDYLTADGAIDRPRLRERVFGDTVARKALEAALHPLIRHQVAAQLAALPSDTPYCLLVVPLLVETGAYADIIDQTWVVDCDESQQIDRVMARSQLSREQAMAIMATQAKRETRLAHADIVIPNTGSEGDLRSAVKVLHANTLQASESSRKNP
ncbi:dephospho-CoA kinase [Chitinimonas sp. BJYL2]|uniref:dephospho-CoA kinase n=1 Tax=Chitinimonas sp. BJYL2 TaxID=2976696 RepID=UPI0022B2B8BB|nr:dephospho-CoA kinase [Chitinimonas sp. BJYL2]